MKKKATGFGKPNNEKLNSLKYQLCRILLAERMGLFEKDHVSVFSTEMKYRRVLEEALAQIESDGLMQGTKPTLCKSDDGEQIMVIFEPVECEIQKIPCIPAARYFEEFAL